MSDPFRIDGPAVVSFSGGRTSAYMLWRILATHGGSLPSDVHVLFANTGKEFPATLDFVRDVSVNFGVPIRWLEYRPAPKFQPIGCAEVSHATASRNGEPFLAMIEREHLVPNPVKRICTVYLKTRLMRRFASWNLGLDDETHVIGLRADEPRRVAKIRGRIAAGESLSVPLADAGIDAAVVDAFWAAHPFDLKLSRGESNCDLCFLKGAGLRTRIIQSHPGIADWWVKVETDRGARFRNDSTYSAIARFAKSQTSLFPILADDIDGEDCACTE